MYVDDFAACFPVLRGSRRISSCSVLIAAMVFCCRELERIGTPQYVGFNTVADQREVIRISRPALLPPMHEGSFYDDATMVLIQDQT